MTTLGTLKSAAAAPAPKTGYPIGLSSNPIDDWASFRPFVNVARLLRGPWGSSTNAQVLVPLSPAGYPLADAYVFAAIRNYPAGTYNVSWSGSGTITFGQPGTKDQALTRTGNAVSGTVWIDGNSGNLFGTWTGIDPKNPPSDLKIIPPGYDAAQTFTPEFLAAIKPFKCLRTMDLVRANSSTVASWSDRPLPTGMQTDPAKGIAQEYLIELCNTTGVTPWLNVPVMSDDNFIQQLAALWAKTLKPGLNLVAEFSNEPFNWAGGFLTWQHIFNVAAPACKDLLATDTTQRVYEYVAWRLKFIVETFRAAWTAAGRTDEVRGVLCGQQVQPEVWTRQALAYLDAKYGRGTAKKTLWAVSHADYFSPANNDLDDPGDAVTNAGNGFFDRLRNVAQSYGITNILAYEAGLALDDDAKQSDPRVPGLYKKRLDAWCARGGGLWNQLGSWGPWNGDNHWTMSKSIDAHTPKWDGIVALAAAGTPPVAPVIITPPDPSVLPPAPTPQSICINCGAGMAWSDPAGNLWRTDDAYAQGGAASNPGTNPPPQAECGPVAAVVYTSQRQNMTGYSVPLPTGTYDVTLCFSEQYTGVWGPGIRIFDVAVQGQPALQAFDIFALTKGLGHAIAKTVPAVSVSGALAIGFTGHTPQAGPVISAIVITPSEANQPQPPVDPPVTPPVDPPVTPPVDPPVVPPVTPPATGLTAEQLAALQSAVTAAVNAAVSAAVAKALSNLHVTVTV